MPQKIVAEPNYEDRLKKLISKLVHVTTNIDRNKVKKEIADIFPKMDPDMIAKEISAFSRNNQDIADIFTLMIINGNLSSAVFLATKAIQTSLNRTYTPIFEQLAEIPPQELEILLNEMDSSLGAILMSNCSMDRKKAANVSTIMIRQKHAKKVAEILSAVFKSDESSTLAILRQMLPYNVMRLLLEFKKSLAAKVISSLDAIGYIDLVGFRVYSTLIRNNKVNEAAAIANIAIAKYPQPSISQLRKIKTALLRVLLLSLTIENAGMVMVNLLPVVGGRLYKEFLDQDNTDMVGKIATEAMKAGKDITIIHLKGLEQEKLFLLLFHMDDNEAATLLLSLEHSSSIYSAMLGRKEYNKKALSILLAVERDQPALATLLKLKGRIKFSRVDE